MSCGDKWHLRLWTKYVNQTLKTIQGKGRKKRKEKRKEWKKEKGKKLRQLVYHACWHLTLLSFLQTWLSHIVKQKGISEILFPSKQAFTKSKRWFSCIPWCALQLFLLGKMLYPMSGCSYLWPDAWTELISLQFDEPADCWGLQVYKSWGQNCHIPQSLTHQNYTSISLEKYPQSQNLLLWPWQKLHFSYIFMNSQSHSLSVS